MSVKVKANAKRDLFEANADGDSFVCCVSAAPVEGRANREVCRLAAEFFGVPKSAVSVLRGETSTTKLLRVEGLAEEDKA